MQNHFFSAYSAVPALFSSLTLFAHPVSFVQTQLGFYLLVPEKLADFGFFSVQTLLDFYLSNFHIFEPR